MDLTMDFVETVRRIYADAKFRSGSASGFKRNRAVAFSA